MHLTLMTFIVVLPSFPNLRRMMWYGNYCNIFQIAATQFCSIPAPCKIVEVGFIVEDYGGFEPVKKHCKLIDEVLTGDNFPSLCCVQLYKDSPSDYFPILQSRGLLEVSNERD